MAITGLMRFLLSCAYTTIGLAARASEHHSLSTAWEKTDKSCADPRPFHYYEGKEQGCGTEQLKTFLFFHPIKAIHTQ